MDLLLKPTPQRIMFKCGETQSGGGGGELQRSHSESYTDVWSTEPKAEIHRN